MTALRIQNELEVAFAPPALVAPATEQAVEPAPARELGDILTSLGRIDAASAERIRAVKERSGRSFAWAAGRLKLVKPGDVQAALAIQQGVLRADRAAFEVGPELACVRRPSSPEAEQFRLLRTRLLTTQSADRLKGFSIAPAGEGVKADCVAANLAIAFAQIHRSVLLIDAGLRSPCASRLFKSAAGGLDALLSGALRFDEALQETPVERLSLLAAKGGCDNPQALLASQALSAMLDRARREFDIVIVLTAPFGPVADGQFVWAATKSALVVARRDVTRADELKRLNVVFRQIGADTIGAVMTI